MSAVTGCADICVFTAVIEMNCTVLMTRGRNQLLSRPVVGSANHRTSSCDWPACRGVGGSSPPALTSRPLMRGDERFDAFSWTRVCNVASQTCCSFSILTTSQRIMCFLFSLSLRPKEYTEKTLTCNALYCSARTLADDHKSEERDEKGGVQGDTDIMKEILEQI